MWFIVGLGNPGENYSVTRHNIGFMVVDALAKKWKKIRWHNKFGALIIEHKTVEKILLVKPQTYMNLSGVAVGALARWYKVPPHKIIVVSDDLDLYFGRLRLRENGSSGGHRGVESLFVNLGSKKFLRLKIGIGRPPEGWKISNYVLSCFSNDEIVRVTEIIERSIRSIELIITDGITKAMNQYNI